VALREKSGLPHDRVTAGSRRHALVLVLIAVGLVGCHRTPTSPGPMPLTEGRWTGGGACLSVTPDGCTLIAGCGHGQFPRPTVRSDGTFDADGTYRLEAGPVSIQPAPPAHFSGSVAGSQLNLLVVPTASSLSPTSFALTLAGSGTCPTLCL
jgi:hypothetical protein